MAADVAIDDLQPWKRLKAYEVIDPEISAAARVVLERHLWYSSNELVAFTLFSDKRSYDEKKVIVQRVDVVAVLVY